MAVPAVAPSQVTPPPSPALASSSPVGRGAPPARRTDPGTEKRATRSGGPAAGEVAKLIETLKNAFLKS